MRNRIDFMCFLSAKDSGGNGDPDNDNAPRQDPETQQALLSPMFIKRRIRDYLTVLKGNETPNKIYITDRSVLALAKAEAYKALGLEVVEGDLEEAIEGEVSDAEDAPPVEAKKPVKKKSGGGKASDYERVLQAQSYMLDHYLDMRLFGGVLGGKGANCGQVRGPVQFGWSRTVDPVLVQRHSLTRMAVETVEESDKQRGFNHTMGRSYTFPFGLFQIHGFVNPFGLERAKTSDRDLDLMFEALRNSWDLDRSTSRGEMAMECIFVFEHASPLGSARASEVFRAVKIARKDRSKPARAFEDYSIEVGELPKGVRMLQR